MTEYLQRVRNARGFYSPDELIQTFGKDNDFLDPFSVLVSRIVRLGTGNVFYPNVIIEAQEEGAISIGNANTFYPNTYLLAARGVMAIGSHNVFGDGGCRIKANTEEARITIGDYGRYSDGATILGQSNLGNGSQILGPITALHCTLGEGTDYRSSDPDMRGAVLKGFGTARHIDLKVGQVINGAGDFAAAAIELQRSYHPKA